MFIVLEGFDKVGKTTLLKEFGKINSWEQVIIDRGPAGYLFFDDLYQRGTEEREFSYEQDLKLITDNPSQWCAIYLNCNPTDVIERHKQAKEDIPLPWIINMPTFERLVSRSDFKESNLMQKTVCLNLIMSEYEKRFDKCYVGKIPTLKINTSNDDLESTKKKCADFIELVKRGELNG